jgi:hypothetical protein
MRHRTLWNRIWKDRQGHVVIWQMPNWFLVGWAVLTFITLFMSSKSHLGDILTWIAEISLIIWALLELFRGVNYFRRALGLLVLIAAIMSFIKNF